MNGPSCLDAYNNVPHVGHAHPRLAEIAADLNAPREYQHADSQGPNRVCRNAYEQFPNLGVIS